MSIHYLINSFTPTWDIVDVNTATTGQSNATGSVVVRVPDGVAIHNDPTNLSTLITEKYDGLLAFYAGFQGIISDPLWGGSTIDFSSSLTGRIATTSLEGVKIYGSGGFQTVNQVGIFGTPPTQVVLTFELYHYIDSDDKTGRFQRTYAEYPQTPVPSFWSLVSFNGGATMVPVPNGTVANIPLADQGNDLSVFFFNFSGQPVRMSSWALVYE